MVKVHDYYLHFLQSFTFAAVCSLFISNLLSQYYPCQNSAWSHALGVSRVSRLRVENFDLTPAHAWGPISHAWLKNVSCCRLAWHNFQKYVNSDPCKERKPCVKWINDNTFLVISSFPDNFAFGRLRTSSEAFGRFRTSSGIFGNDRVIFKIPSTPRIKISYAYISEKVGGYRIYGLNCNYIMFNAF